MHTVGDGCPDSDLLVAAPAAAIVQNPIPPVPGEKITAAQKKALAEFVAARGEPTGPLIALLRSPDPMTRYRALSDYLRYNSTLPPRLSEIVILMTARQWTQAHVWNSAVHTCHRGWPEPEVAKAIIPRRRPERMAEDDKFFTISAWNFIETKRSATLCTLERVPNSESKASSTP